MDYKRKSMGTWRIHLRHLENSIFQSSGSQLPEIPSFSEEVETVRGRNSETGGRFPDLVSAFAKRQKSDREAMQSPHKG